MFHDWSRFGAERLSVDHRAASESFPLNIAPFAGIAKPEFAFPLEFPHPARPE